MFINTINTTPSSLEVILQIAEQLQLQEDFTQNGKQYDLFLDVIAHRSVSAYKRALRPNGSYFVVGGSVATLF
jgi:hypothetical protein